MSDSVRNFVSTNWLKPDCVNVKNPLRTRIVSLALPLIAMADIGFHKSKGNIQLLTARFAKDPISKEKMLSIASSHFKAAKLAQNHLYESICMLPDRLYFNPSRGYESKSTKKTEEPLLDFRLEDAQLQSLHDDLHQTQKVRLNEKRELLKLDLINKKIKSLKTQLVKKNEKYLEWNNYSPLSILQWPEQRRQISALENLIPKVVGRLRDLYSIEEADLPSKINELKESQAVYETREEELKQTIKNHPRTPFYSPIAARTSLQRQLSPNPKETAEALNLTKEVTAKLPKESMLDDISSIAGEKIKDFYEAILSHNDVIKSWTFDRETGDFEIELKEALQIKLSGGSLLPEYLKKPLAILTLGTEPESIVDGKILLKGKMDKKNRQTTLKRRHVVGHAYVWGGARTTSLETFHYDSSQDAIIFKKGWKPKKTIPFESLLATINSGEITTGDPREIVS
ncbi:MAG: hypothetical protein ACI9S8_003040 [Chlamydiales bacterium]|jgi:hypothetical protein